MAATLVSKLKFIVGLKLLKDFAFHTNRFYIVHHTNVQFSRKTFKFLFVGGKKFTVDTPVDT